MSKNHLCQVLLFRLSGVVNTAGAALPQPDRLRDFFCQRPYKDLNFLPVSFPFQRMECRFYDMECKFRPMERMFQPLEWSTCQAKATRYSSGIRAVCRSKARCA